MKRLNFYILARRANDGRIELQLNPPSPITGGDRAAIEMQLLRKWASLGLDAASRQNVGRHSQAPVRQAVLGLLPHRALAARPGQCSLKICSRTARSATQADSR
jgi:hypothetical protein